MEPSISITDTSGNLVSQMNLKTMSIHDYSQLSEMTANMSDHEPTILIARIAPLVIKNPEAANKFMDTLYTIAVKNDYSIFRLGEERIILTPHNVKVCAS